MRTIPGSLRTPSRTGTCDDAAARARTGAGAGIVFGLATALGCSGAPSVEAERAESQALASPPRLSVAVRTLSCGANQRQDAIEVINTGSSPVRFSDIAIKYWVDDTSGDSLVGNVWAGGCATSGGGNPSCVHPVSGVSASATQFAPACGPDATHQANWEITLTSTDTATLAPGAVWSNVQSALHLGRYGNFSPGAGSSFSRCEGGGSYVPDAQFAVYVDGVLASPAGSAPPACRAAACPSPLVWSIVPGSPAGVGISGSGPKDVWLIGAKDVFGLGPLLRGDGVNWKTMDFGLSGPGGEFAGALAMWVNGPNDVLASNLDAQAFGQVGGIYRWDGTAWTTFQVDDNRAVNFFWGSAENDVWGGQNDGQYLGHWDGQTWTHVDSGHGGVLAGGAPGDFWHFAVFVVSTPPSGFKEILGFQHHEPSGDFDMPTAIADIGCPDCAMNAGWASATNDVWFVGDAAAHFDGAAFRLVATPAPGALRGVWGTGPRDVWAVGDGGAIVHFDGTGWSSMPSPTTNALNGVWASGPCDVWAIGDAVYHATPR